MGPEMTSVDALTDFTETGYENRIPFDQEIDKVVDERDQGVTPSVFGFQQNSLRPRGFEDLAVRRLGGIDHFAPPGSRRRC